jgi:unsaturated rhamnogalacturonyl hydrolase
LGQTYWTRASGWLLWAITAMLRRLTPSHPSFGDFRGDLQRLVEGMLRVQDSSGGFRVLLDDPSTPLESTGTLMFAVGLHESLRRGWLPASFRDPMRRAWDFVAARISDDGALRNAYVLWATPAEKRQTQVGAEKTGWVAGFVLAGASEITRA